MESRVMGNCHARFGAGENLEERICSRRLHILPKGLPIAILRDGRRRHGEQAPGTMQQKHVRRAQSSYRAVGVGIPAAVSLGQNPRHDKEGFREEQRRRFCSRIATGDYDAIIIGHSQFEKIPMSKERQERLLQEQIQEITDGIQELKFMRGEQFTIKQMERTRKQLEGRLRKLQAEERKDDVVTFEELGVDRLFVDEAHGYKNLFLTTKMRNVAGLSTSEAQKSTDMFLKCRYMDELTAGRGVVFATGTPVSNSMTEMYTMQRYLQYDTLKKQNMTHFDAWASTFGETTTAIELAPEGYTLVGR